jgi:predicted amidohydrolase YtcJ
MTGLLVRGVDLGDRARVDCRLRETIVAEIGDSLPARPDETVLDGENGALIPGFADHHLHLAAMAAQHDSVDLTPVSGNDIATALASAEPGRDGWIRAVGYDEAHGDLDREVLDRWRRDIPVRVQHRSGALWVLNSAGLTQVGAETAGHPGIEREPSGRPTGKLWRADDWLRVAIASPPPSLAPIGRLLATFGVTHVADATPGDSAGPLITDAVARGELAQKVVVMGTTLGSRRHPRVTLGPYKIVIPDHEAPDLDGLVHSIARAHAATRPVALHCVTRTALAVALAALDTAGVVAGDRIEHCAVADLAVARQLAERGLRVITQPTLIARRGDTYWNRSEAADRGDLWRYGGLLRAGARVAPSSDAPYGDADPWACLRAARDRATPSGRVLDPTERVPPETTLRGLLSTLDDPGGPPREVRTGSPADLVLLDRPLADSLAEPSTSCVRATIIDGRIVYQR